MIRLFNQSDIRKISTLDARWDFVTDRENCGTKEKWYIDFPNESEKIYVPSSWNNEFGMENYIGCAWYRTTFTINKPSVKLVFGAINNECDIYLDGKHIGSHVGAFCEFSLIAHNIGKGKHSLIIRVDNTQNETDTIPLKRADWFNHGGIIRSIELHEFDSCIVDNVKIEYQIDENLKNADVKCFVDVYSDSEAEDTLTISAGNEIFYNQNVKLVCGTNTICASFAIKDIKLWDIESPNLYKFKFALSEDDLFERTGFRTIKIDGRKFLLNDKEIFFKGINRHEEYPEWGFAVPFKLIKKDVDIICNMGCNTIRGSHYPNSKATLDYLDERGILFWEEIPMWGFGEEPLKNDRIIKTGISMHREMIRRDYNHPCVIIWGLHNEIATQTKAAYDISAQFIKEIRSYDNSRLITYATMKPAEDICFELADFISLNKYIGWYEGELESWETFLEEFHDYLKKFNVDNKPLVISEFGAAAITGNISFENLKWTENYQAEAMAYMVDLFMQREDISGLYIWQYADLRTSNTMVLERARSYNNKGIVSEYRKPKMAYYAIRDLFARKE